MVNSPLTLDVPLDPEVALALAYAPAGARAGLRALWAFDARLAGILRATREPVVGQMRLSWWHNAVADPGAVAGEPVLSALRATGLPGAGLQRVIEGWEALLAGDEDAGLRDYAAGRGGGLFALTADVLGSAAEVGAAGRGWALVDLARHHSRPAVAARALALAADELRAAPARWRRADRPLGMLTKLARRDLTGVGAQGSPRRLVALAMLALRGR